MPPGQKTKQLIENISTLKLAITETGRAISGEDLHCFGVPLWHCPPSILKNLLVDMGVDEANTDPYGGDDDDIVDLFVIVRNPYDRAVSQYFHHAGFHKSRQKHQNSKQHFNRMIKKVLREFKTNSSVRQGHYIPQYNHVYDVFNNDNSGVKPIARRIVKHVLKLDSPSYTKDFHALVKQYGLNITLSGKRIRARNKKATLTKYDLDEQSCELIEEIYRKDFEEFGYDVMKCT